MIEAITWRKSLSVGGTSAADAPGRPRGRRRRRKCVAVPAGCRRRAALRHRHTEPDRRRAAATSGRPAPAVTLLPGRRRGAPNTPGGRRRRLSVREIAATSSTAPASRLGDDTTRALCVYRRISCRFYSPRMDPCGGSGKAEQSVNCLTESYASAADL